MGGGEVHSSINQRRFEDSVFGKAHTHFSTQRIPNKRSHSETSHMGASTEFVGEECDRESSQCNSLGYYSRFFVVEKKEKGKWRSILDLSQLNLLIPKEKFRMESTETIRSYLDQGLWVTSIDLSDAYYHIPVHPKFRKYMRFSVNQQVFQYRAMVMGLTTSPRLFTKVIKCIKVIVQKFNVRLFQYLDDWIVVAPSQVEVAQHTKIVIHIAQKLGFIVNIKKSELVPTQEIWAITIVSTKE